jgi:hypothetical protein
MGFWDTVTDIGSTVFDPLDISGYKKGKQTDKYQGALNDSQVAYQNAVNEGVAQGKSKAESLYGKNTLDTLGSEISGIAQKRKELAQGEDPSIGLMKRSQAKEQSKAQTNMAASGLKGAYAQKALGEINTQAQSQIAAQDYKTRQANLSNYQQLLGNIASSSISTELGYGQLRGAGISTPAAEAYQSKGILGGLLS